MTDEPGEITALLARAGAGDARAADELMPAVYSELRSLASRYLRDERPDHTLQPTALVHEAYVRLVGSENQSWESRAHFFRVAARAMRRILVDHARGKKSDRRGGQLRRVSLTEAEKLGFAPNLDILALDAALSKLSAFDPRKGRVVEMRFFVGLTAEESGRVLGVNSRTVERDWRLARAWLLREMNATAAD